MISGSVALSLCTQPRYARFTDTFGGAVSETAEPQVHGKVGQRLHGVGGARVLHLAHAGLRGDDGAHGGVSA